MALNRHQHLRLFGVLWRTALACSAVLFAANLTFAVTISGKVRDNQTGESVPGATVMIVGTQRGAAANVEGLFSIPDLPTGKTTVSVSALGYKALRKEVDLEDGNDLNLILKLQPEALQMGEVNVQVEQEKEREYTPQVAHVKMETRQLAALPQLMEADLFRSLQIMPGVLATSDFSADLNIWGGSSDQNLILLNGIDVYKPVHLGGLFSVFNMDAIKDVNLIKGGFGAKYGGRLSAVVDVADREGNRNKFTGKAGLSFLSTNATLEGPLPKGSWLVAGRRTYVDWASKTLKNNGVIDDDFPYYFYDLNTKVTRDFSNGDRISPSAYFGRDVLQLTSNTDDQIHMTWGNATYSIPFVHVWTHKLFSTNTVAGSFYDSDFRFQTSDYWFKFKNKIQDFTFKSDMTWFADSKNTLDFGVQAKAMDISFFIGGPGDTLVDHERKGWLWSAYATDDYRLTPLVTITPGLRLEHNEIANTTDLLPRLAAKVSVTSNSSVTAAWGMYSQYLQLVSMGSNLVSIFDSYVPIDKTMNANRGQQYALSYDAKIGDNLKINADTYYKKFKRIIELTNPLSDWTGGRNQDRPLSSLFNVGDGDAYGFDFFMQGEYERWGFMAGYGLGRSERTFPNSESPGKFAASFDRLHNSNLFFSRKMTKRGTLEVRLTYGTGQPITKAIGYYSPGLDLPGQQLESDKRNNYRIPDYHRLDIAYRLRYEYKHWKLMPYFEIINVYNRKNVLSLDYQFKTNPPTVAQTSQLPFLPSIGVNVEF
jgi:hypothetical protein